MRPIAIGTVAYVFCVSVCRSRHACFWFFMLYIFCYMQNFPVNTEVNFLNILRAFVISIILLHISDSFTACTKIHCFHVVVWRMESAYNRQNYDFRQSQDNAVKTLGDLTTMSPAKIDELIAMQFGRWTLVGPVNHVSGGSPDPARSGGNFWAGTSPSPLCSIGNIRCESKLFGRWQQRYSSNLFKLMPVRLLGTQSPIPRMCDIGSSKDNNK